MLEFLIHDIFTMFGGRVFQQNVDIPMGTNCAPILADLLLYSYEAYIIQGLLEKNNFLGLVISLIASIPLSVN